MRMLGSAAPLRESDTETDAQARAIIIRALCGLSRFVYEMAAGHSAVSNEPACVPLNPQGTVGVDLSGPPFGPALRHVMGGTGGIKPGTDMVGEKTIGTVSSTSTVNYRVKAIAKPYAKLPGAPYSRRYFAFRAWTSTGTKTLTVTIREEGSTGAGRTLTVSIVGTTETTYIDSDFWVGDGAYNLQFAGSSADTITIGSITMNNIVKLTHN
jgi:hypothetical protein